MMVIVLLVAEAVDGNGLAQCSLLQMGRLRSIIPDELWIQREAFVWCTGQTLKARNWSVIGAEK